MKLVVFESFLQRPKEGMEKEMKKKKRECREKLENERLRERIEVGKMKMDVHVCK